VAGPAPSNPFRFGALALDDAFADRERELAELKSDVLAGQDVVLFAPRRFGKSSLVWRVSQELLKRRVLVAAVDLMTTPTLGRLADKLARSIHEDIASPLVRARERLRVFQGLRVTPTVTVDPGDGSLSFSFSPSAAGSDLAATIERLLELPGQLAGERNRRVVLVLDEFQEVVDIDPGLPRLMRSVFQGQPEVSHIYLGSRRHMIERLFNDVNEPFWRSAKRFELGVIEPAAFRPFIAARFADTGRRIDDGALDLLLEITRGHPYATQELGYFLWQRSEPGRATSVERVREALSDVLHSEDAHFTLVWEGASAQQRLVLDALALEEGRPMTAEYRRRHGLPAPSSVQRALEALDRAELVSRSAGRAWIREPFLAQWVRLRTGTPF
jgi:AAA+ ATPase superfamily predicted ATPase